MKRVLLLILSAVLLLSACSAASAASYDAILPEQAIGPLDSGFVSGMGSFGISAASMLYKPDENLAISPVSIALALCMARAGAQGETKDEMTAALGLSGLTDEQITAACKALMWRANTGGMEAANALWLLRDYEYREEYIKTCTEDYMADLKPLIIPGAKKAVNEWAKEKTHGRIDSILPEEPSDDTRMIITNALYYLGEWERPFDPNSTFDREFATPSGAVTVPFMHSSWYVPYYENAQFSMITLEFKAKENEGKYAMAFLLPAESSSVGELLQSLDGAAFKSALDSATDDKEVKISLPKFEFEYFAPLNETLSALGMKQAFSPDSANFSGITDTEPLFISNVLHKCYVRVDERGAEAAAVTAVEAPASEPPMEEEKREFIANRPFVFAIYSLEDGALAFIGAVNNPSK
ncbi:MAG: serpin family protein [Christensenellaceae bacterium]|nr:serpin family protein [Christensenellaceae bacterium]